MRSITMKHFRNRDAINRAKFEPAEKGYAGQAGERVALGQIVGDVFEVRGKLGTLPDGTQKESLVALGEFIAVNYLDKEQAEKDGKPYEPLEATQAYLPGYFAETLQAIVAKSPGGAGFAVELFVVPNTGPGVPYMYEVKSLMARPHQSRLSQILLGMQQSGTLRIPVPGLAIAGPAPAAAVVQPSITVDPETGEVEDVADDQEQVQPSVEVTAGEQANAEDAKTKRRSKAA